MTLLSLQEPEAGTAHLQPWRRGSDVTVCLPQQQRTVLAVAGLAAEARLAAGPGVITVMAGGDATRLRALLLARTRADCSAVISIGIAGGLDPLLAPGDVIVATGVVAASIATNDVATRYGRHVISPEIARGLATRLYGHPRRVIMADLAGVDRPVLSPRKKHTLRAATGALAVDMESHVAAAFAARHGLPFAAVRVVCDPAQRTLPDLTATALRPDGTMNLGGLVGSLLRRPMELFALPRLARDAAEGFRALRRCRELLGHGLGMHELGGNAA